MGIYLIWGLHTGIYLLWFLLTQGSVCFRVSDTGINLSLGSTDTGIYLLSGLLTWVSTFTGTDGDKTHVDLVIQIDTEID